MKLNERGLLVVISGPSGSGKSTFLRCLNLLEKPEQGKIYFEGVEITGNLTPDEKYEQLSYVIDLQSFIYYFSINVYLCNTNMNEIENYLLWRTRVPENEAYGDTKWRWIIYLVYWIRLNPPYLSSLRFLS